MAVIQSACWYSAKSAADLLGVKVETINRLCREGKVKGEVLTGQAQGMTVSATGPLRRGRDRKWRAGAPWRIPVEWLGPEYAKRRRR